MSRIPIIFLVVACIAVPLSAQQTPFDKGRAAWGEGKWKDAIEAFTETIREEPANGQGWFWLGLSRYKVGAYEGAINALIRANNLNTNPGFTRFALARCHAKVNERDLAYDWLEKAAEAGFSNVQLVDTDEAFTELRKGLEMDAIRNKIEMNTRPTESDARFRQMDFWIGDWEVFDQSGTLVGTNTITKEIGGAMLLERWTSASGNQGSSINFFDPGTGKFKQQWVDQTGYNTAYEGEMVDGSMVMIGVNADIKGVVSRNRMTFTPNADGTVTQLIETYNESTTAWTQSFLGIYKRRSAR